VANTADQYIEVVRTIRKCLFLLDLKRQVIGDEARVGEKAANILVVGQQPLGHARYGEPVYPPLTADSRVDRIRVPAEFRQERVVADEWLGVGRSRTCRHRVVGQPPVHR
jgi:hypothetical protein